MPPTRRAPCPCSLPSPSSRRRGPRPRGRRRRTRARSPRGGWSCSAPRPSRGWSRRVPLHGQPGMSWKTLVVLAVLVAGLGGFLLVDNQWLAPKREKAESAKGRLWTVEPKDVESFTIARKDD